MKSKLSTGILVLSTLLFGAGSAPAEEVPIAKTCADCKAAGNKMIGTAVQSKLKTEASLIGLAYLNYIYQNDLTNAHFCEAMLLMNSQVPDGTANPYVGLFKKGMGEKTLALLEDVQLSFDYSIGRSNPPEEKLQKSLDKLRRALCSAQ